MNRRSYEISLEQCGLPEKGPVIWYFHSDPQAPGEEWLGGCLSISVKIRIPDAKSATTHDEQARVVKEIAKAVRKRLAWEVWDEFSSDEFNEMGLL